MPLRLLAFLPPAMLITGLILVSVSSLFSVLDTKLSPTPPELPAMQVQRYETTCDVLHREIHDLSRRTLACGREPGCVGSPLLCPIAMDADLEHEYQRLRHELNQECGVPLGLMDFAATDAVGAWSGAGEASRGAGGLPVSCAASHFAPDEETDGGTKLPRFFEF